MRKKSHFIKKEEDFECEVCGKQVKGSGYTNHCPRCLYSKHLDRNLPGDRAESCQGLMEPVDVEVKGENYILTHRCRKCGKRRRNKASKKDKFEVLLRLSKLAGKGAI